MCLYILCIKRLKIAPNLRPRLHIFINNLKTNKDKHMKFSVDVHCTIIVYLLKYHELKIITFNKKLF